MVNNDATNVTTNLEILNINGVDCYEKDGTAYLKLENVARGLGFTETAASGNKCVMWRRVRKYLADLKFIDTSADDNILPDFIPENIFYRLAMKAKNETAEKFQALVADEIIPSIRKHGGYIAKQETLTPEQVVANALIVANNIIAERDKTIAEQKEKIESQKPLVEFATHVSQTKDTIDMDEMAKIARDENIDIGRNRLIKWLKSKKVLKDNNVPYQEYITRGYLDVIEVKKETTYGALVFPKTVITGKGQIWIVEKLRSEYKNKI